MSVLSVIAFVFGTLGVWLTIKQNVYCWPVSLVAVVASIVEFYEVKLFGDMALQVFYLGAGIYGWIYWSHKKNETFVVTRMNMKVLPLLIGITAAQVVLYYYLLVYFGGDKPVFDAVLTACSLTVTYMMTKKWVENWLAWVLIDAAYVVLYGLKCMWLFGGLYLFMAAIAFYGWIKWRKTV